MAIPFAPSSRGGRRSGSLSLGRPFGIPLRFHWSWLLLFGLVTWSMAAYFGSTLGGPFGRRALTPPVPGLGRTEGLLVLGAVTAGLFGLSLLAHELAHSLVAQRNGIRVRSITLFFFGGVAEIASQPRTPGAEFRVAVVGPLMSLVLAGVFWLLSLQPDVPRTLTLPSEWLARTNLMLALFNLLPGFPLDGGRIFRSAIWRFSGSARKATRIASSVGRLVGFSFIIWGAAGVFGLLGQGGGLGNGLWQVFIGLFLQDAARRQAAESDLEFSMEGMTVAHALAPMVPSGQPLIVRPDTGLLETLRLLEEHGATEVSVEVDGQFVGVLTRDQLLRYLRVRRGLAA